MDRILVASARRFLADIFVHHNGIPYREYILVDHHIALQGVDRKHIYVLGDTPRYLIDHIEDWAIHRGAVVHWVEPDTKIDLEKHQ
jgi:hypothetical protein